MNNIELKHKGRTLEVNNLLKKAFNVRFFREIRGDQSWLLASPGGFYNSTDGKLEDIVIKGLLSERFIGEFIKEDGSAVKVHLRYSEQMEKYAQLYKNLYGKKVSINFIEN